MLDVIRRHGLLAFTLAIAVVSLGKAAADAAAGRFSAWAGVAFLMTAILAEEMRRRDVSSHARALHVVRWAGLLGALATLLLLI